MIATIRLIKTLGPYSIFFFLRRKDTRILFFLCLCLGSSIVQGLLKSPFCKGEYLLKPLLITHTATDCLCKKQTHFSIDSKKKEFFFFCLFVFSRAAPEAYGGSQARGWIGAVAAKPTPEPQQHGIRAMSANYTTAHSNTGSLTHWVSQGMEPTLSQRQRP